MTGLTIKQRADWKQNRQTLRKNAEARNVRRCSYAKGRGPEGGANKRRTYRKKNVCGCVRRRPSLVPRSGVQAIRGMRRKEHITNGGGLFGKLEESIFGNKSNKNRSPVNAQVQSSLPLATEPEIYNYLRYELANQLTQQTSSYKTQLFYNGAQLTYNNKRVYSGNKIPMLNYKYNSDKPPYYLLDFSYESESSSECVRIVVFLPDLGVNKSQQTENTKTTGGGNFTYELFKCEKDITDYVFKFLNKNLLTLPLSLPLSSKYLQDLAKSPPNKISIPNYTPDGIQSIVDSQTIESIQLNEYHQIFQFLIDKYTYEYPHNDLRSLSYDNNKLQIKHLFPFSTESAFPVINSCNTDPCNNGKNNPPYYALDFEYTENNQTQDLRILVFLSDAQVLDKIVVSDADNASNKNVVIQQNNDAPVVYKTLAEKIYQFREKGIIYGYKLIHPYNTEMKYDNAGLQLNA